MAPSGTDGAALSAETLRQALEALGGQVWMTGADPALFAELAGRADLLHVVPGQVERLSS